MAHNPDGDGDGAGAAATDTENLYLSSCIFPRFASLIKGPLTAYSTAIDTKYAGKKAPINDDVRETLNNIVDDLNTLEGYEGALLEARRHLRVLETRDNTVRIWVAQTKAALAKDRKEHTLLTRLYCIIIATAEKFYKEGSEDANKYVAFLGRWMGRDHAFVARWDSTLPPYRFIPATNQIEGINLAHTLYTSCVSNRNPKDFYPIWRDMLVDLDPPVLAPAFINELIHTKNFDTLSKLLCVINYTDLPEESAKALEHFAKSLAPESHAPSAGAGASVSVGTGASATVAAAPEPPSTAQEAFVHLMLDMVRPKQAGGVAATTWRDVTTSGTPPAAKKDRSCILA